MTWTLQLLLNDVGQVVLNILLTCRMLFPRILMLVEQKFLNVEDKTCFFYKHIAINHGVKSPTKRIPYEWIFPSDFSLKN